MKDITARLYKPGEKKYTGTAWLCSQEYALTAAHCVGDRVGRVPMEGTFRLKLGAGDWLEAEVADWDPDVDAALLRIKGGKIPEDVKVKLGQLPSLTPWPVGPTGFQWQSWGFASGNPSGTALWGYIDEPNSYITDDPDAEVERRQHAIQLTCEQGGFDNLPGISGAAVSFDKNVVVGLVRSGPPSFKQRVIYAAPLKSIVEAFPEVKKIFDANLKQAIDSVSPNMLPGSGARAEAADGRAAPAASAPRPPELFGREHDIAEVGKLLGGGARLLTFVGERGVGKTVLAQAVGRNLSGGYQEGVYFVDLSLVRDAGRVAAEIAHALGVKESPDGSFEESLGAYLGDKHALIILDGFEYLEDARPLVEGLLAKTRRLQFIVTCRAALGWARERVYAVGPLSLDAPGGGAPETAPAVALFLKRARRANPAYSYDPATLGEVRGVCETLGGLPLAVELAAALSATPEFSPALVLERLKAGGGAGDGRLAALVELCYESLEEGARECLRRLAIFSGPVTPDAAEAVAASAGAESEAGARKELSGLSRRSLLDEERLAGGQVRYRVPRPVLVYCARKLEEAGETASARRAHAVYYAQLTRRAERRLNLLTSAERRDWLERLEAEHEEIRAAIKWSLGEAGNVELGLELVGNMFWFWNLRAYLTEGRRWADEVLAAARPALKKENKETEALGKALYCAGGLAFMHGDYAAARATLEENVGVWERLSNHRRLGYTLIILGVVALNQNELEEARRHEERGVKLFREVDDRWGLALALNDLAKVCLDQGKEGEEAARSNYQQSLAVWRELDDKWGYGLTTGNLGNLYYRAGDLLMAKQHLVNAAALQRDEGNQWGWAESIKRLGHITFDEGDYAQAARLFYDSMVLHQKIGRKQLVADCLDGLARVAAELGRPAHSARLFGAATAIRRQIGSRMSAPRTAQRQTNIEAAVRAAARGGMTREEFQTHWDEGEAWALEAAVAEATGYAAEWRA
ncbi:MAG TPA: tetratricopeptide repeat protein [Pyrinomonadaceae bacterium]|jgi:non-specific serine/threonine protein kinase